MMKKNKKIIIVSVVLILIFFIILFYTQVTGTGIYSIRKSGLTEFNKESMVKMNEGRYTTYLLKRHEIDWDFSERNEILELYIPFYISYGISYRDSFPDRTPPPISNVVITLAGQEVWRKDGNVPTGIYTTGNVADIVNSYCEKTEWFDRDKDDVFCKIPMAMTTQLMKESMSIENNKISYKIGVKQIPNPICGNEICEVELGENYENCSSDCKSLIICGDHECEGDETFDNCRQDCPAPYICGDGICDSEFENNFVCSEDCLEEEELEIEESIIPKKIDNIIPKKETGDIDYNKIFIYLFFGIIILIIIILTIKYVIF